MPVLKSSLAMKKTMTKKIKKSMKGMSKIAMAKHIVKTLKRKQDSNDNAGRKDSRKLHKRFKKAFTKLEIDDEAVAVYKKLDRKGKQDFIVCSP